MPALTYPQALDQATDLLRAAVEHTRSLPDLPATLLALDGYRRFLSVLARHADLARAPGTPTTDRAGAALHTALRPWQAHFERSTHTPGSPWHDAARRLAIANDVLAAHLGPDRTRADPWAIHLADPDTRQALRHTCADLLAHATPAAPAIMAAVWTHAGIDQAHLTRAAVDLVLASERARRAAAPLLAAAPHHHPTPAAGLAVTDPGLAQILHGAAALARQLHRETTGQQPARLAHLRLGVTAGAALLATAADALPPGPRRQTQTARLRAAQHLLDAQRRLPLLLPPTTGAVTAALAIRDGLLTLPPPHRGDHRLADAGTVLTDTSAAHALRLPRLETRGAVQRRRAGGPPELGIPGPDLHTAARHASLTTPRHPD